jgi:hypothetical protein
MHLLLAFAPFVAFFAAMRLVSPLAGLCAASLVSLWMCLRMWRRRESVKVLEIGTLMLFVLLLAYTVVARPVWTVATVRLAVDGGLFAIAAISLLIGKPFTLQYAREQVPPELWNNPRFIAVNRHLTLAWTAAFLVMVLADVAAEYVPAIPLWVDIAATVAAMVGAVLFTVKYPAAVRRRAMAQAEAAQAAQAAAAQAAQARG